MNGKVQLIEKISNANGISGFETEVVDVIKSELPNLAEKASL